MYCDLKKHHHLDRAHSNASDMSLFLENPLPYKEDEYEFFFFF